MSMSLFQRYSEHFGWQLQERLQNLLKKEYFGEVPVGEAVIIETFEDDVPEIERDWMKNRETNEGQPIHFLISAPTNRVPSDIHDTVNAYLAFRAVLLAGMNSYLFVGFVACCSLILKLFSFIQCIDTTGI